MATTTLSLEQRMAALRIKASQVTWEHTAFKTGDFAGAFVGIRENGKFYIGVTAKVMKGGNEVSRFANFTIDPIATGLMPEDFSRQWSAKELADLITMLHGPKAKIVVKEYTTPQWGTHKQALDKDGNLVFKGGMPIYSKTEISDVNDFDVIINANNVMATSSVAEDTF